MPTGLRADTHLRAAIILFARHDAGEALYNLRCANEVRTGDIFTLSLLISLGFSLKRPDLVRKYAADMKAAAVDMKQDRIAHLYITPLQKSLNGAFSSSECQRSIRTLRLAEAAAYDDLWEDTSELLQQTDVQHLRGPFDIYCCHRLVAFAAHVHKERRSVELQVQLAEDSFPSGFRVDVPLRLLQANVLAKRGQEPEAKEVLQQLWSLTKSPDEFSMRVAILSQPSTFKPSELLSSVLRALLSVENDPVKKGPLLEEALRVSPSDSLTHEHIDLLISQGQASRAMSELQRLVKANPGDQRAHVQLARLYQNEERYEEALKHYKAASSPEKVLKHIALCCYKTGLISEAIENYRGALVSQPQSSHILYQLGVLYEKEEGQPNEARGFYQQIAKDTDSRYSYYSRLALANIAMNALDFALACFHCDEALEHLCADEQVRVVKAEALLSQYDAAGAFAQLDGMRPVEPTSIWAADYMGLPCEASRLAAELSETCALNVIAKAWIRLREAGKEDVRSDDMEGTALGVTVFQCYGRLILNSRLLEVADTLATALQRIEHVKRVDPSPLRGLPPWLHASTLLYVSLSQFMLFKTDVETQLTVKRFLDLGRKCGGVFGNERGYLDQFVPDEFLKELFDSDKTTTAAEQFSRIRYMGLLPANHSSFIHFRLFLDKSPLVFTQTLWTDVGAAVVSRQAHTCDVMAAVHSVSSQLPLNAGHYRVLVQLLLSCLGTHHRANLTSKLPKLPKPRIHVTKTPHPNCFIPPSRPFVPPPLRGRPMVVEPDTVLPKKTAITAPTNHPTLLPLDRKATDPNPVTIRRLPRKLVLEVPRDLPAECFIQRSALVLGEALGKGSFGKVMSGSYHGRPVAVKQVFIDAKQLSSRLWNDIVKEVESLSKLHHPSLVEFVGASFDPGEFLIVTELCARGSLSMLLHGKDHVKPTPLNWIERLSLALQISKGVHFLHNRKVIHRDLKVGVGSAPHSRKTSYSVIRSKPRSATSA
ncbi:MAG: uncharacterized protein KVP18_004177 [Porospora cf. gigantea A]|uniref:uncharacterized protein n=1 Tax=Porospora cf. gigantea A TaxID=2853593 RepID=UPI00355A81C8|nr:MAG: hypothetical protein KVP18_004177 [Porospora cf. gigantea A]